MICTQPVKVRDPPRAWMFCARLAGLAGEQGNLDQRGPDPLGDLGQLGFEVEASRSQSHSSGQDHWIGR